MANDMIIVPTKNKEEFFDPKKFLNRISNEFGEKYEFRLIRDDRYREVGVWKHKLSSSASNRYPLFTMRLYDDLWMIDKKADVDTLDELGLTEMASDLIYFLEFKIDDDRGIGIRRKLHLDDITYICRFLRYYYQCYIFDEGIHPEFIYPLSEAEYNKTKSSNRNWIDKFKNFFPKS